MQDKHPEKTMRRTVLALAAGALLATPIHGQTQQGPGRDRSEAIARFVPAAESKAHRLDWGHWDEALGWLVIPMGPSLRLGAPRVQPGTGTRRVYGHDSRFRLEGNRAALSFVTPEILAALSDYRADLERIGSELELARLPRNEQLAFWLNLHNVAVMEALVREYPLRSPLEPKFGPQRTPLDEARLVTVAGVSLSPRDIRERIVYPNWRDPKVIYGFWRGAIGGPSIQRLAYTADNVDALLALSAEEFVNSLRGVEAWGGALRVSPIYDEAAGFYFPDDAALRRHLAGFAGKDVSALLRRYDRIAFTEFEGDLADLELGETDPNMMPLVTIYCGGQCGLGADVGLAGAPNSIRTNPAIVRLMRERQTKLQRAARRGVRSGMVIYGDGQYAPDAPPKEVE